ncbi:uncharacterized protein [Lepisosteus oculatus]|uniref:uncharacterized protein n=1 Tax=Lepisosteus oculatus TaxID=7918 RepID=UPI0035F50501
MGARPGDGFSGRRGGPPGAVTARRPARCGPGQNLRLGVATALWVAVAWQTWLGVSADPVSVSVRFGGSVSLPCDGSAYRGTPEDQLFFLWQTEDRRVCEYNNGRLYTGPGFENRAEVSRETIRRGNFSLTLHHASFSDEDIYKCSYEHERDRLKFLGSVHLIITAHSDVLTLRSGDSLSLPLHTAAPVEVLFDPAGSAQSPRVLLSSAGLPGPGYEQRVWVQDGSLTLRSLTPADQGSYTVRDLQGNTISTAIVTVEARRDTVTLQAGASLSVPLLTGEPVEVLFDPAGGGNWTSVCSVQNSTASCVPQYRDRVSVDNQELRLQELRASDQGSYTVRDLQGNTISAVIVSVEEPPGGGIAVVCGVAVGVLLVVVATVAVARRWTRREADTRGRRWCVCGDSAAESAGPLVAITGAELPGPRPALLLCKERLMTGFCRTVPGSVPA